MICNILTNDSGLREQRETGQVNRERKRSINSALGEMAFRVLSPSRGQMSSSNGKKRKPAPKTNPATTYASTRRDLTAVKE